MNTCTIVDMAIPGDSRLHKKEQEKIEKYQLGFEKLTEINHLFLRRGENRSTYLEKDLSESRELTDSTPLTPSLRIESNPGHIGGRRVLSPLRCPCPPRTVASSSGQSKTVFCIYHTVPHLNVVDLFHSQSQRIYYE